MIPYTKVYPGPVARSPVFRLIFLWLMFSLTTATQAQEVLTLSAALEQGAQHYQSIKAKQLYADASQAMVGQARNEYLPNVIAAVQQNYGTINGQFGPLGAVGVLGVASAGPAYSEQSWNAAFGALYIISANWEVFSFGRVRSHIRQAEAQAARDAADVAQEQFVQNIKLSSAYLNLLIAQTLVRNGEANLSRAEAVRRTVKARTVTGLNPGVDSSLANADVSRARLALIELRDNENQLRTQLAQLMVVAPQPFVLDTAYLNQQPNRYEGGLLVEQNPQLRFYQARIEQADRTTRVVQRNIMPGLTLFGVYQARASGFDYNYTPAFPDRYSSGYGDGIKPSRYNYIAGISLTWNLLSPLRIHQQVRAQRHITEAFRQEYDQLKVQLEDQTVLADQRITNARQRAQEAPVQHRAAADAYLQKSVLYKNGLTNIVDLQQAMYTLNRAETDRSVASINVWLALLLKAASTGDFDLFIQQAQRP